MVYVIQAQEQEISYELLQQLAAVVAETPGLTHADATYRVHNSHGMLAVEEKAEAVRISQRFTDLGFPNFVLEKLLDLPKPEHLNLESPDLGGEVELAVGARLHLVTEKTVRSFNAVRFSVSAAITGIPMPGAAIDQRTVEESDTRYCLDLFGSGKHWRVRTGTPVPIRSLLSGAAMANAFVCRGVQSLMQGDHDILTFEREQDYEKYVTWLYQVRYAKGQQQAATSA